MPTVRTQEARHGVIKHCEFFVSEKGTHFLTLVFRRTVLALAAVLWAAAFMQAQTVSTIYNFAGNGTSPANPWYVTLVQGTNGNLYGTTCQRRQITTGTVFNVSTTNAKIIYGPVAASMAPARPAASRSVDGNFYGTTQQGHQQRGHSFQDYAHRHAHHSQLTRLRTALFPGVLPSAADGNFYGTTSGGMCQGIVYVHEFRHLHANLSLRCNSRLLSNRSPTQGTVGSLHSVSLANNYCGTILKMSTAGVITTPTISCGSADLSPSVHSFKLPTEISIAPPRTAVPMAKA
jgi:hypothetical protein